MTMIGSHPAVAQLLGTGLASYRHWANLGKVYRYGDLGVLHRWEFVQYAASQPAWELRTSCFGTTTMRETTRIVSHLGHSFTAQTAVELDLYRLIKGWATLLPACDPDQIAVGRWRLAVQTERNQRVVRVLNIPTSNRYSGGDRNTLARLDRKSYGADLQGSSSVKVQNGCCTYHGCPKWSGSCHHVAVVTVLR